MVWNCMTGWFSECEIFIDLGVLRLANTLFLGFDFAFFLSFGSPVLRLFVIGIESKTDIIVFVEQKTKPNKHKNMYPKERNFPPDTFQEWMVWRVRMWVCVILLIYPERQAVHKWQKKPSMKDRAGDSVSDTKKNWRRMRWEGMGPGAIGQANIGHWWGRVLSKNWTKLFFFFSFTGGCLFPQIWMNALNGDVIEIEIQWPIIANTFFMCVAVLRHLLEGGGRLCVCDFSRSSFIVVRFDIHVFDLISIWWEKWTWKGLQLHFFFYFLHFYFIGAHESTTAPVPMFHVAILFENYRFSKDISKLFETVFNLCSFLFIDFSGTKRYRRRWLSLNWVSAWFTAAKRRLGVLPERWEQKKDREERGT